MLRDTYDERNGYFPRRIHSNVSSNKANANGKNKSKRTKLR